MFVRARRVLPRLLGQIGMNRLLNAAARRPGLVTLAYHRIGEAHGHRFDDALLSATADGFRAQLMWLREHFDLPTVDELVERMRDGHLALDRPTALVTFDDGYRDNAEIALPILQSLGVPAVFFVAAGYIDTPRLTWWDHVAYVVKRTTRPSIQIRYPRHATIELGRVPRSAAIRMLLRIYKDTPAIDRARFLAEVEAGACVPVDDHLGRDLFMSWDDVRTLSRAGMEVGGHTYDHPVLSRLSPEQQLAELNAAKVRLEAETGRPVRLMAYPVGGRDAFTATTKALARSTGHCAAFSYYGGFNRAGHDDLFDLRRVAVEREHTLMDFCRHVSSANVLAGAML